MLIWVAARLDVANKKHDTSPPDGKKMLKVLLFVKILFLTDKTSK